MAEKHEATAVGQQKTMLIAVDDVREARELVQLVANGRIIQCDRCEGTGRNWPFRCSYCRGKGYVLKAHKPLDVDYAKGEVNREEAERYKHLLR
jgi:DnaJ-class molecular chaperone